MAAPGKSRIITFLNLSFLLVLLTACVAPPAGAPAATAPPLPTQQEPTNPPVIRTERPSPVPEKTVAPEPTSPPAETSTPVQQPPPAETITAATPGLVSQVNIFLIAVGDNGVSGKQIGCEDSVIAVERPIEPTQAPLRAALTELLTLHNQFLGESGLYNALYQSDLAVDQLAIDPEGTAVVALSGSLLMGGECDAPRVKAQIEETILQFPTVKKAEISINGTPLDELLSLRG